MTDAEPPSRSADHRPIHSVPAARLAWGTYDPQKDRTVGEGDIHASYSADKIAMESRVRNPFRFGDALWVNTGMSGYTGNWQAEAYRLVARELFSGSPTSYHDKTDAAEDAEAARNDPNGFYHGMLVVCGRRNFVLCGPPAVFTAGHKRPGEEAAEPAQLSLF
jgi:hypothetical protein